MAALKRTFCLFAVVGMIAFAGKPAQALEISDMLAGSEASANVVGSSILDWVLNGANHSGGASYYYGIGSSPEALISSLPLIGGPTLAGNSVNATYGNGELAIDFGVEITAVPGVSSMTVTMNATSSSNNLDLSIFEVHNMNLSGTAGDDTIGFAGGATPPPPQQPGNGEQTDADSTFTQNSEASILGGVGGTDVFPSHWELSANPAALLALMTDGDADTLADTPNDTNPIGAADVAHAFQWDASLMSDDTLQIIVRKQLRSDLVGEVIPEPVTSMLSLLGLAVIGGTAAGRRRSA